MAKWHRTWQADVGLRGLGLAICTMAYLAIGHLMTLRPPALPRPAGIVAYGLAVGGFLGASAGTALTLLGRHLFDEIEVSDRWRARHSSSAIDVDAPRLERVER